MESLTIDPARPFLSPSLSEPRYPQPGASDSRAKIACRFITRSGGCKNFQCPFSHDLDKARVDVPGIPKEDASEFEEEDFEVDFARNLSGAAVRFEKTGAIQSVSLPSDFSVGRITGLPPKCTSPMISEILRDMQLVVAAECIRIPKQDSNVETMAIIRVEDPQFITRLIERVSHSKQTLTVTPILVDSKPSNARKIYISWHRPIRTVWLNYTTERVDPYKVAQRFNSGEYDVMGQMVKATAEKVASFPRLGARHHVTGTVTLYKVPGRARHVDVKESLYRQHERPAHIEMGAPSYKATDAEVYRDVRLRLEDHGPLESFYMPSTHRGNRVKATALFHDEADARSSCSLNDTQIPTLNKAKLTVTLVQGVKLKVSSTIYRASKSRIDQESNEWKENHLTFHVYTDPQQQFTTLKVEGNDTKLVAKARKSMEGIFEGILLKDDEAVLWSTALNRNGDVYKQLKVIEKDMDIVISRDRSKRQLHFHGPLGKLSQAVVRVGGVLKEGRGTSQHIDLDPTQFSWAMRGGFKSIQQALGEDVPSFDIVSKRIAIQGTARQRELALDMIAGRRTPAMPTPNRAAHETHADCPICFCEAENPISTSCNHTYCLDCFEEYCKATTSSSTSAFQVKCQGDGGNCSHVFTLQELRDSVSSSALETVLKSSFEEHVKQHPDRFRYCPTPDCDHVYRCTSSSGGDRPGYTCSNCLELICTACHALHGQYTCAEYKDIQSGGYQALEQLKKELNIRDCPKCMTSMEKTEGCNHMTCGGCKAHICWVCMAVFSSSQPCYDHMNQKHGGIGLGLERFAY